MAARIVLLGLPTDRNSSVVRGPAKAPPLVRAMLYSDHSNPAAELGGELGDGIDLADRGDLDLAETGADDAAIRDAVAAICASGAAPLSIGGDHSVTYPVLQVVAAHHGPVSILHIDAHPDLYDELGGNRRSHASPFARIMEEGLAKRLVQVGIRTLNGHQREQAARFGVEIVPPLGFAADRVPVLEGPVYISIDLDGLDPSVAPGVSHQEPGGLTVREVLAMLDAVRAPVVGGDVVEYNPDRDVGEMTAIVAAKLVKELAALIARNHPA